ncbi:von Willebrand factor A domain-containing protein 5A-like [Hemiscyllium ocellatum]|uniref:von Willebrand factor A domain-containing protein 5A-like n=1 Tax=Hemiscyllium ocellatum TaxID=170820 RepID=UPI0029666A47|nr:von Willebrand factor A domain-containing protein 5A-like [Hemiscyllium ocellatum]
MAGAARPLIDRGPASRPASPLGDGRGPNGRAPWPFEFESTPPDWRAAPFHQARPPFPIGRGRSALPSPDWWDVARTAEWPKPSGDPLTSIGQKRRPLELGNRPLHCPPLKRHRASRGSPPLSTVSGQNRCHQERTKNDWAAALPIKRRRKAIGRQRCPSREADEQLDSRRSVGAKDEYDDAISSGHQAFLLEEDSSSGDIFCCTVGNLPPGQRASVSLSFVQELAIEADGAVRFVLPSVLNPRYTPRGEQAVSVTQEVPRVRQAPYTLALEAQIQSTHGISRVQSNCTMSGLEYLREDQTSAKISLADGHRFDKDVELLIYYKDVHTPSALVEAGVESAGEGTLMGDPTVMVSIYPTFPEKPSQHSSGEFIFLMDCSGSMDCPMAEGYSGGGPTRVQSAQETLLLLLKSLPLGCYFNIYRFGSSFNSFFPESVEYNQQSMKTALATLDGISADMGGTEILEPLRAIYRVPCRASHPRQLFVFTDGEVSNTKMVIDEVRKNAHNHRCFSFGIGQGASTQLIKGIAKAASGNAEFITGKDRMQPKVLQSLKFALQPAVSGLTVGWELPSGLEAVLLSPLPTVIFNGQRSILYAQLKGKVDPSLDAEMSLKYSLGEELIQNSIRFKLQPQDSLRSTAHRLAAKRMIEGLESGAGRESAAVREQLVQLSSRANVLSSQTAFVAINKDLNQPLQGPLVRRNIPHLRSIGCVPTMMFQQCAAFYQGPVPMMGSVAMAPGLRSPMKKMSKVFGGGAWQAKCRRSAPSVVSNCTVEADSLSACEDQTPAMKLISVQNADGSWSPDNSLEELLGLKPQQSSKSLPHQGIDLTVWMTILAVIWLHAFSADTKDEWELLVGKSLSWIKAKVGSDLEECLKAGNALLNCSVDPHVFSL